MKTEKIGSKIRNSGVQRGYEVIPEALGIKSTGVEKLLHLDKMFLLAGEFSLSL